MGKMEEQAPLSSPPLTETPELHLMMRKPTETTHTGSSAAALGPGPCSQRPPACWWAGSRHKSQFHRQWTGKAVGLLVPALPTSGWSPPPGPWQPHSLTCQESTHIPASWPSPREPPWRWLTISGPTPALRHLGPLSKCPQDPATLTREANTSFKNPRALQPETLRPRSTNESASTSPGNPCPRPWSWLPAGQHQLWVTTDSSQSTTLGSSYTSQPAQALRMLKPSARFVWNQPHPQAVQY